MNTIRHDPSSKPSRRSRRSISRGHQASQLRQLAAQQDKVPTRSDPSAEATNGSLASIMELFDSSDHDSAVSTSIEGLMTEDEETEDHTMEDMPAAEDFSFDSELAYSSPDEETPNKEKSNEEALEAASRWPRNPSKKDIARLPECRGLDDDTSKGRLPKPTTKDVLVNALASFQFLREMGEDPIGHGDIGIDSGGHLFKIDPTRRRRDHHNEFCDMVLELKENWKYDVIRDQMQTYLAARDAGYFDDCAHEETKELASLIDKALRKKVIGLPKLEAVAAECKKVVETLDKIITLVNAVKQDLLDTGSTSFKRWKQLQSTGLHVCLLKHLANGVLDAPTPAIIEEMVKDITQDISAWQARLGLTLKLARDLELTMEAIRCD